MQNCKKKNCYQASFKIAFVQIIKKVNIYIQFIPKTKKDK